MVFLTQMKELDAERTSKIDMSLYFPTYLDYMSMVVYACLYFKVKLDQFLLNHLQLADFEWLRTIRNGNSILRLCKVLWILI